MFNLDKFISDFVTKRPVSMFLPDIEANKDTRSKEIRMMKKDFTIKYATAGELMKAIRTLDEKGKVYLLI